MTKDPVSVDRLVGNRIRVLRRFRRLSVAYIADNLAISKKLLHEKESGKQKFLAEEIVVLSKIFQIQPSSLFRNLTYVDSALPVKTSDHAVSLSDFKKAKAKLLILPKSPSKPHGHS